MNGTTKDLTDFYESFDLGLDLGLAYNFKKLAIDLRYNYGLKDLLNQASRNGSTGEAEATGSNRVVQFSLCYFLK